MNLMQVVRELEDTIALNEKRIIELEKSNAVLSDCHVADVKRIIELEKLMPSKSTFELLRENADQKARIADLEDKLSGKTAKVQIELVEKDAYIAELVEGLKQIDNLNGCVGNYKPIDKILQRLLKPKENE